MRTVCELNKCAGCMACIDICAHKAISIVDTLDAYNAVINEELCVNCNACHKICQANAEHDFQKPILWLEGWANNPEIRLASSSGGMATAIAKQFIVDGGKVCSCYFVDGKFLFKLVDSPEQVQDFTGSKYVKSNPQGIYRKIKREIIQGQKVLFIGLPCQVAAVKKYVGPVGDKLLFTIDLICHGTPSPKLLEMFLTQSGTSLKQFPSIRFRIKNKFQIFNGDKGMGPKGAWDKYTIAFLNGLTYTENCYSCIYAQSNRQSDITLGDSWGSVLEKEQGKYGISLALIQNEKGKQLINEADVYVQRANAQIAVASNHQLSHPSLNTLKRRKFFHKLKQGDNFSRLIFWAFPKTCTKQMIKGLLIKFKILKPYFVTPEAFHAGQTK